MRLAQGCVTGFKDVTVNSVESLMIASAQQLVSVVIEATFASSCILAVTCSFSAAENSTVEFWFGTSELSDSGKRDECTR